MRVVSCLQSIVQTLQSTVQTLQCTCTSEEDSLLLEPINEDLRFLNWPNCTHALMVPLKPGSSNSKCWKSKSPAYRQAKIILKRKSSNPLPRSQRFALGMEHIKALIYFRIHSYNILPGKLFL